MMIENNNKKVCQGVEGPCSNEGQRRRQGTAYVDDSLNWVVMCDSCHEHNEFMWEDMWREYNSERL